MVGTPVLVLAGGRGRGERGGEGRGGEGYPVLVLAGGGGRGYSCPGPERGGRGLGVPCPGQGEGKGYPQSQDLTLVPLPQVKIQSENSTFPCASCAEGKNERIVDNTTFDQRECSFQGFSDDRNCPCYETDTGFLLVSKFIWKLTNHPECLKLLAMALHNSVTSIVDYNKEENYVLVIYNLY